MKLVWFMCTATKSSKWFWAAENSVSTDGSSHRHLTALM